MAELSAAMKKLIELDKKKAEIKQYYEDLKTVTQAVVDEIGVDGYFKDPSDGTVFKMVEPEGRFIYYQRFDYCRTKKPEEKRGELSMKEAEETFAKVAAADCIIIGHGFLDMRYDKK